MEGPVAAVSRSNERNTRTGSLRQGEAVGHAAKIDRLLRHAQNLSKYPGVSCQSSLHLDTGRAAGLWVGAADSAAAVDSQTPCHRLNSDVT